jgi:hypothetical protein
MRNEKNIEALKARLLSLGFPSGCERGLRAQICFGREAFTLPFRQQRDGDILLVQLHFQKEADTQEYHCLYYDACLQKRIDLPAVRINEIEVAALELKMADVAWYEPAFPINGVDWAPPADPPTWQREEAIEGIIADLNQLAQTEEGAAMADRLKLKFWANTQLEAFIPNASHLKNAVELNQRFYFFENEEGITLEEAYRFLLHRWREKQLSAVRKAPRSVDPAGNKEDTTKSPKAKAGSKKGTDKRGKGEQ